MPHLHVNQTCLYYEDTGGEGEVVLFSHGLLWSSRMFKDQIRELRSRYRVIAYDHRGQGRSDVAPGGYDMDTLMLDGLALMDALGVQQFHFAGLSMGGFVGLRLGARHPERLRSLILMETSAQAEPAENIPRYRMLNTVVALLGVWAVKNPVMKIMFGEPFLQDPARASTRRKWELELTGNRKSITRAVRGVISRKEVPPESLARITCPTLIIVGEDDVATVPAKSEYMHELIPNSRLVRIPGVGHTSTVEAPKAINQAINTFLQGLR